MRGSIERNVTLGTLAAGALLLLMAVLAIRGARSHFLIAESVAHTQQVVAALETTRAAMLGAESSNRAYLLTGDPRFLASASADRGRADSLLAQLQQLTADEVAQRERTESLRLGVRLRFDIMDQAQRIRDEGGVTAAAAFVAAGQGRDAMGAVQKVIDELREAETGSLAAQLVASQSSASLVQTQIKALVASGIAVLAAAYWLFRRERRAEVLLARKLDATEARIQPLIENMGDGLVTTTETGKIVSVNPAAERIFGYRADELVGRYFKRLLAVPEGDEEQFLQSVPRRALGHVTEWDGRRQDGSTFPLELSLSTFHTESGRHYAGTVRDVSERREIDRMKNEFISVVSHELRTPLTSIQGALQLVLGEKPAFADPEHEPLLTIALNNCARLIRIINDILDVSKIESGQVELRLRPCAIDALVDTAIESVAESARAAGVSILVDLEPEVPAVRGDFDRLVQVLVNVLSNAVKFSPSGATVLVRAQRQEASMLCSIRDQGRGIKEEHLGKLFRKFQQIDGSATRKVGGTGLGLAIVKAIVEQHKGTVSIDSRYGEGTTVLLTLPTIGEAPAADAAPPPSRTASGRVAIRTPPAAETTVLLAEDDRELSEVLTLLMTRRGFVVRTAENGEVACRMFDEAPCDVVVLDLQMPKTDGFQVIEHLRRSAVRPDVPIVVMSGVEIERGGHVSLELGANVFLSKPLDPTVLLREINRLLPADLVKPGKGER